MGRKVVKSITNILLLSTMVYGFIIAMHPTLKEIEEGKEIIKKAIAIGGESIKMVRDLEKIPKGTRKYEDLEVRIKDNDVQMKEVLLLS